MKTPNETISDTADYFDLLNERSPTRPPILAQADAAIAKCEAQPNG